MTDPWPAIRRVWDDVQFASIVRNEAKRTLYCHPDRAEEITAAVADAGLADLVTVVPHWICVDEHQVVIADHAAIEASLAESLQHGAGTVRLSKPLDWGAEFEDMMRRRLEGLAD